MDGKETEERERERKGPNGRREGREGNKRESKLGWRFVFVRGGNE